jgi:hypothetical protein
MLRTASLSLSPKLPSSSLMMWKIPSAKLNEAYALVTNSQQNIENEILEDDAEKIENRKTEIWGRS